MKSLLTGLGLTALTLAIMLGISELAMRQFFDPLDYLQPTLVSDPQLGHRIAPYSTGHDAWGYRNRSVPDKAQIVMIGDSQIYGTASTSAHSIPSLLQKKLGAGTYNLALGGYGPAHYSILLDRAFKLSAQTILLGVYFGNDFMDAFNYVYDKDHAGFSSLRQPVLAGTDTFKPIKFDRGQDTTFRTVRNYLAGHSVLYRITTAQLEFFRIYEQRRSGESILEITDQRGDVVTGITLKRAQQLDVGDPRIAEGVRLTLHFIDDMKARCDAKGVKLVVVLIPTRFSTYKQQIALNRAFPAEARQAVAHEEALFDKVHSTLIGKNIKTIDLRKPLQEAAGRGERLYPVNDDHPNNHGNEVIATYIDEQLSIANAR